MQLSAGNAGGAFHLLAWDRDESVPQLTDVSRFTSDWEKQASVQLRLGHQASISAYESCGRIVEGSRDDLLDRIYQGWKADTDAGLLSIMVAADTAADTELNRRARRDRVAGGQVAEEGLNLAAGQSAGVGDQVITRQNDRTLVNSHGVGQERGRWTVTCTWDDGRMTVRRATGVSPSGQLAAAAEIRSSLEGLYSLSVDLGGQSRRPTVLRDLRIRWLPLALVERCTP